MTAAGALDDTRGAEDVRELSGSTQDRVTIRLLREGSGGDEPSGWITELVCILFNAQGEVLQIARGDPNTGTLGGAAAAAAAAGRSSRGSPPLSSAGYFGEDDNLFVRRQRAKDAAEKEVVAFSLSKLHAFVEVVGVLVTYAEDEIARSPRLNAFRWTCDLSSSGSEEDAKYRGERPSRAFEYCHDPKLRADVNVVVMGKFYRNHTNRSEWRFHAIGEPSAARCSIAPVLAEAMQVFLLDIIPEIEIPNRNALTSVLGVCAALSFDEFLGVEQHFPAHAGVSKDDFARILLLALMRARPELQRVARASALVALLFEMFEQIDINGDARVDWEEFTTFCMSLGLIATSDQELGTAGLRATSYRQVPASGGAKRSFPYQISRIKTFAQLKRIAVLENKSAVVLMYDADLVLHHEMNGVEKLLGKTSEVLDVDHIAARNLLAISSSDHAITLWAIVNPTTGAYVFSSKIVTRSPVVYLKWCSPLKRLIASGADDAQLWDIDFQRVDARLSHHKDRLADYVELGATGLFATCSFDHTIAVWEAAPPRVAFVLEGHAQGVLTLDYMQNTLLSSGFEYQAYCWSLSTRSLLVTLGGHQHRLIGAKFVSSRSAVGTALAVTGDESGHFRLWNVSRCVKDSTSDLAKLLQSFELHTPNHCRFSSFACGVAEAPKKAKSTESELADIIVGNLQLYRFQAITQSKESAPPRHVVYNAVANTFVGSVDGCVTVWNANSGVKTEEPIHIRDADVCGLVFDAPRERKLFIATSDGCIRLYNPITGMLMTKSQIHDGVISSLLFCPRTCCLISTGYDRNLCISHSTAGKTDVEVLRTVENAHESCITACAFSADLDLVATGDDSGSVQVYDFQKLYLLFRCEGHRHEIRALHFHVQAPLLISGDSSGVVFIWQTTGVVYTASPLMRLATAPDAPTPSSVLSSAPPITSICSTPESVSCPKPLILAACENGDVYAWDFRVLVSAARKRAAVVHFESQIQGAQAAHPAQQAGYNPLLRVAHKQSVLKLRPEDRNGILASSPLKKADGPSGALVCASSLSWRAHDDTVLVLRSVPDPGLVFTASQDGSIKVWDASHECIGAISTLEPVAAKAGLAPGARSSATSDTTSAWKFTHHLSSDASQRHARIAAEVIRKHAREKKRAQRLTSAAFRRAGMTNGGDAGVLSESPPASSSPSPTPLKEAGAGIDAILATQLPFSDVSIRSGVQQGLFGALESRQLKEIAHNSVLLASLAKKGALAPLPSAPDELATTPQKKTTKNKRAAKVAGTLDETECRDLGMLRTMTNFPLELQRRSVTRAHAIQALDIAPSPFLLEKLSECADVRGSGGARSTPKRKLKMRMDASVVVLRNVSLPKLPESLSPSSDASAVSGGEASGGVLKSADDPTVLLKASASAPVLGHAVSAAAPAEPEDPSKRSNVERKLKLYEDIVVGSESSRPARTAHRHSQPTISAWKTEPASPAAAGSGGGGSPAKRKSSQPTIAGGFAHNPFGPYYTPKQVIEFGSILTRFDVDLSGDIDQREWVAMLQSCRPSFGLADVEATEKLFRSLDRDDSGRISLHEILPAMFSKATPEQLLQMRAFIRAHTDDRAGKRKE